MNYPNIDVDDIRIFSWSSKPNSGFSIGIATGVHLIHLPSKLEFKVDSERSQHRNKHIALNRLSEKLKEQVK